MTPVLPDTDDLVREALTAGYATHGITATVWTLWPDDWYARRPLTVARRAPGGAAADVRFLESAFVTVTSCAASRPDASLLARQSRAILVEQCSAQFASETAGGYLSHFFDVSGPAEDRSPGPVLHTDAFRFTATYRITSRPLPA